MKNGQPFPDTNGNPIHAHGGWMLNHGGYTYWYGEDRRGENYVSVYRASENDLRNWEFRGHILTTDTPYQSTSARFDPKLSWERDGKRRKVNIERPKVVLPQPDSPTSPNVSPS